MPYDDLRVPVTTTVTDNESFDWAGGVYCHHGSTCTIRDTTIAYNHAAFRGGGLTAEEAGKTKVNFKGKGDTLPDPLPMTSLPPDILVVVRNSSTSTCFSATYSTAKKNQVNLLQAP